MYFSPLLLTEKRPVEIVFTLGSANPYGRATFNWEKKVVKGMIHDDGGRRGFLVDNLKAIPSIVYGLVVYADKALPQVQLGDIPDKKEFRRITDGLTWPGEGKAFEEGLLGAEELFKNSKNQNSRKVVVLFTNSKTTADTAMLMAMAKRFILKEIKLYVVAVGDAIDDEQITVITGNSNNVVKVQSSEQPTKVSDRLSGETAKGELHLGK